MVPAKLQLSTLKKIVSIAEKEQGGQTANYIPELANVDDKLTAIAVLTINDQKPLVHSNLPLIPVTLQSTAKLIPLIGLLEEYGEHEVFKWVEVEPSGDDFASIIRLERFGPKPSNPMLNAGAITLCSYIPGVDEKQFAWLESWVQKLFKKKLTVNTTVFASEKRTGDRNRALAYLLKSRGSLASGIEETMDLYFTLCSYEAVIDDLLFLPALLANAGRDLETGESVISPRTCQIVLSILSTCGLYDETGAHMVNTGIPAKSGVSGYILGIVPGVAGIVTLSPRVNAKGSSIRGEIMLEELSKQMSWHFATLGLLS